MKNKLYISKLAYSFLEKGGMEREAKEAIYNEARHIFSDIETAQTIAKEAIESIKNADESLKQFNGWNRLYGRDAQLSVDRDIQNYWTSLSGIKLIPGKQNTIPYGWLSSVRQTLDDPDRLGGFSSTEQKTPRHITKSMHVTRKHQKYVIPFTWVLNNLFNTNFENELHQRWDEAFWNDQADLAWNGTASTGGSFYALQKSFIAKLKETTGGTNTPEGETINISWGGDEMVANKVDTSAASSAWTYATMANDIDVALRAFKSNVKTRHYLNKGKYRIMMSDKNADIFDMGRTSTYTANDGDTARAGINNDTREKILATGNFPPYRGLPVVGMPYMPDDVIIIARLEDFAMGYQTEISVTYERKAELTTEDAAIAGEGAGSPGLVVNKNYYTDLGIVNPDATIILYNGAKCETPVAFDSAANVANVVTVGDGSGALVVYPFCATPDCELYADSSTISDTYATAVAAATLVAKGSSYSIDAEDTGYFKAFRNGVALPSTELNIVNEA